MTLSTNIVKAIVFLATINVASVAQAQEPGKLAPLPDKLTPSVEARVGSVDFANDHGLAQG
jgi:hypothetical protein